MLPLLQAWEQGEGSEGAASAGASQSSSAPVNNKTAALQSCELESSSSSSICQRTRVEASGAAATLALLATEPQSPSCNTHLARKRSRCLCNLTRSHLLLLYPLLAFAGCRLQRAAAAR